jgi:hypothetical protein
MNPRRNHVMGVWPDRHPAYCWPSLLNFNKHTDQTRMSVRHSNVKKFTPHIDSRSQILATTPIPFRILNSHQHGNSIQFNKPITPLHTRTDTIELRPSNTSRLYTTTRVNQMSNRLSSHSSTSLDFGDDGDTKAVPALTGLDLVSSPTCRTRAEADESE